MQKGERHDHAVATLSGEGCVSGQEERELDEHGQQQGTFDDTGIETSTLHSPSPYEMSNHLDNYKSGLLSPT